MPSLKAIRKRIVSVRNTRKITSAMKLVAAARLRRAQDAITAARPYAQRMTEVVADLAAHAGAEAHPLLTPRDLKAGGKVAMVVLTSDRGLSGSFNSGLIRRTERYLIDEQDNLPEIEMYIVGRKGRDYFRRRNASITKEWSAPSQSAAAHALAHELAPELIQRFLDGELAGVFLVYNEFKSAISQKPSVEALLPVQAGAPDETFGLNDFRYEPSREELLAHILPLHIETQIFRAILESVASEFGARMSAMDSATRNASDMIASLTLEFNRARQAAITKELMEIVGGAEALKG